MDPYVMLLGHRPANGANHGLDVERQPGASRRFSHGRATTARLVARLDLGGDDQSLFAGTIDRECGTARRTQGRVALFDRQLDILGVEIAAADDDQVLQAAGDE